MQKKILLSCLLASGLFQTLYAGEMGAQEDRRLFKPFLVGEAAYSWPMVSGVNVELQNTGYIHATIQNQGWGGRFGAGAARTLGHSPYALTFEGGLMYNDHISVQPRVMLTNGYDVIPSSKVIGATFDQYGLDLLAGLQYERPKYMLFVKAGALLENLRTRLSVSMYDMLQYNRRQANFRPNTQQTLNVNVGQAMPEVKVGGGYRFNDHWTLTGSWMHAFGGTLAIRGNQMNLASNSVSIGDVVLSLNNPTINAAMFGFQYQFS